MVRRAAAFQLAWLAQPRAAKFFWFVAACLHPVLRAKRRCSARRALLRLELRLPELCPLRHATPPSRPRFAGLTCRSRQSRSARTRVTFDGSRTRWLLCNGGLVALTTAEALPPGVHVVVDISALVPQQGNLFVRQEPGRHDRNRVSPHLVVACRMFWCEAGGSGEISATDGKIKRDSSLPELRS